MLTCSFALQSQSLRSQGQLQSLYDLTVHSKGIQLRDEPLWLNRDFLPPQSLDVFKHHKRELLSDFLCAARVQSSIKCDNGLVLQQRTLDQFTEGLFLNLVATKIYVLDILLFLQNLAELFGESVPEFVPLQHQVSQAVCVQQTMAFIVQNSSLVHQD